MSDASRSSPIEQTRCPVGELLYADIDKADGRRACRLAIEACYRHKAHCGQCGGYIPPPPPQTHAHMPPPPKIAPPSGGVGGSE